MPYDEDYVPPRTEWSDAANALRTVLVWLGEEPKRAGLLDTPDRVLRAWRSTWGARYHTEPPLMRTFPGPELPPSGIVTPVAVTGIKFCSHCEHHLAPFFGTADVSYEPKVLFKEDGRPYTRIVGLSKLARAVAYFAAGLQTQERLTSEVADFLMERLDARRVEVTLRAHHTCMSTRGVFQPDAQTCTTAARESS